MASGVETRLVCGRRADGQVVPLEIAVNGAVVVDEWELLTTSDLTLNNSNKAAQVPAGYQHQILWIYVSLTTTAVAGNRQLAVVVNDIGGNPMFTVLAGAIQAASLTRTYTFAPSLADLTAFRGTYYLMTPLPPTLILNPMQTLRVLDTAAIDAAADDMLVYIQYGRKAL